MGEEKQVVKDQKDLRMIMKDERNSEIFRCFLLVGVPSVCSFCKTQEST